MAVPICPLGNRSASSVTRVDCLPAGRPSVGSAAGCSGEVANTSPARASVTRRIRIAPSLPVIVRAMTDLTFDR
jgi:hypothetical protein